ncbi:MAG: hypothetical protein QOC56_769 [Alphaproteobacteria bacterium]|nr:hypothetical protein [Alphaproteobacteria bacterium]
MSIFSSPPLLWWYAKKTGADNLSATSATDDFLRRAATDDISPVRFFEPGWFRARYRVNGANAFLAYLGDRKLRLARPSPIFAPRWYARRHGLIRSPDNPFVHFLVNNGEHSPHPLVDIKFLREQSGSWCSNNIALEFLVDPDKFRLKPHPLFDGNWYLDKNPDVASAGMNPLEHYLRYGSDEGRAPNRLFNPAWYREMYLNPYAGRFSNIEPFTHYVTVGFARSRLPLFSLRALAKATIKLTPYGPAPYVEALRTGQNIHVLLKHRPDVWPEFFKRFSITIQDHNPACPPNILLLRDKRVAIMYTPKCASARLVYWWLDQAKLLDFSLRFSAWSHSFDAMYHWSREYIEDGLRFEPKRYDIYKFVRNPLFRAASGFTHLLHYPREFGLHPSSKGISFMEVLEQLGTGGKIGADSHFRPQLSSEEQSGKISPRILKIEDGLDAHLRSLEAAHALPPVTFDDDPEIRWHLGRHSMQNRSTVSAGPDKKIRFHTIPDYRALLTPDAVKKLYSLYRADFDTYRYAPEL